MYFNENNALYYLLMWQINLVSVSPDTVIIKKDVEKSNIDN